jgi:hypothetical protein
MCSEFVPMSMAASLIMVELSGYPL